MRYVKKDDDPVIGATIGDNFNLDKDNCFIIQGNVNTGNSLRRLREKYGLEESPVFAFVISEGAEKRHDIKYNMMVGHRSILPWETEAPLK